MGGFGSQMRSAADVRWNASQEGKINIHAVSAECDEIILSTEQGDILVAPTHLGCCVAESLSFNLAALLYCKRFGVFLCDVAARRARCEQEVER